MPGCLDKTVVCGTFLLMETPGQEGQKDMKKAAVNGLAIVGIGAVVIGALFLIIFAARFVPEALSRLASAVYLSPSETVNEEPVVEEEPVEEEPETPGTPTTPTTPTTGGGSTIIRTVPTTLYGLPDLTVEVLAVGYLRTSSANSFVQENSIDEDDYPAIRFRVRNNGTNAVNYWQVEIEYPTRDSDDTYVITSSEQLRPRGYKDFTFGFDNAREGDNRRFTVTVDPDRDVAESNEGNNVASRTIDIGNGRSSSRLSCDIWVSPSRIDEGDRATLRWDTSGNPDRATINQGIGRVDEDGGSERVSPRRDTTYRLTVEDGGDEEDCSVTLRVDED